MTYLTTDTTEQIIPVSVTEINGIAELTVSALDVYRLINPKNTNFLSWINRHFKFLVFVDGKDFVSVSRNAEAELISDDYGDTDYYIRIHTAKALVLLSGCKAKDPVIKYLNDYSVNVRNTDYEKRRLFDPNGLVSIWFMKRVWYWLDYKPAGSGDVRENLETLLSTRTEREASLVNELQNAINQRFSDSVSEYEVNQFIETWCPSPKELPYEIFDRISFWLNRITIRRQPNSIPEDDVPIYAMTDKLMFEAPLTEELLTSIKQKFPNCSNENAVRQFIRIWIPAPFDQIPD